MAKGMSTGNLHHIAGKMELKVTIWGTKNEIQWYCCLFKRCLYNNPFIGITGPKKQKKWKVTNNNICLFILIILSPEILESDGQFLNKTHAMFPIKLLIQESMTRFCLRTNLYLPAGQLDSNMYIFIDLIQSIIIVIIIVIISIIIIM